MGDKKDSFYLLQSKPQQKQKNLHKFILKLSKQSLKTSQIFFEEPIYLKLQKQFEETNTQDKIAIFIQQLITELLNWGLKTKQALADLIKIKEYEILEGSLQKAEQEIRRHIRLEQQMKLYLDNLEEKIEELEEKLLLGQQKYHLLSQSYKELDSKIKESAKRSQQKAQSNQSDTLHPNALIHQHSNENVLPRKNRIGLKSRLIFDKIQQKSKKIHDKKHNYLMSVFDQDLTFQRSTHQMKLKNSSIQRYKKKDNIKNTSIGQLTNSLQMKRQKSFENYVRKMSKYRTLSRQQQGKSNSIISQSKL